MSEPAAIADRSELPEGWGWANWSKAEESRRLWNEEFDDKWKQRFRHRFMEIIAAIASHRPLPREKVHYDRGIGKAKVTHPSPGWRALFFQDGEVRYVTHFTQKGDKDHEEQIATALEAKAEHMRAKARRNDR